MKKNSRYGAQSPTHDGCMALPAKKVLGAVFFAASLMMAQMSPMFVEAQGVTGSQICALGSRPDSCTIHEVGIKVGLLRSQTIEEMEGDELSNILEQIYRLQWHLVSADALYEGA